MSGKHVPGTLSFTCDVSCPACGKPTRWMQRPKGWSPAKDCGRGVVVHTDKTECVVDSFVESMEKMRAEWRAIPPSYPGLG